MELLGADELEHRPQWLVPVVSRCWKDRQEGCCNPGIEDHPVHHRETAFQEKGLMRQTGQNE